MLPKVPWLHTPVCLSLGEWSHHCGYLGHWDIVQFFCVFLLPLLNIICFVRSIAFLSFIVPIFAWNIPLVSLIFLKSFLFYYFPLFICIVQFERGFLISPCYSSELCFQMGISFLSSFPFSSLLVRPPQTTILPCCFSFSWGCFWSPPPVQC